MDTETQDYDFMQKVADAFQRPGTSTSGSLRAVALKFGIARTKVRKILITLGAMESPLPEEALKLQENGMKLQDISDKLGIPISTLSTYLPYVSVMYNGEGRSANALRIGAFRERILNIAKMQHHQDTVPVPAENTAPRGEVIFSTLSKANLTKETPMSKTNATTVMRLNLELNLDELPDEDWETLREYCDVKKGYSREILAPSDMTLHGLHYAIMQLFGWLNGHLRRFSLPDEVMDELTQGRLEDYLDLVGLYFRPPIDPDDDDCFWDDDYEGRGSFKVWLRKKYTRPFRFLGRNEQFMTAKKEADEFRKEVRKGCLREAVERVRQQGKAPIGKSNGGNDIVLEELRRVTDFTYGDLLERLELSEILAHAKYNRKDIGNLQRKANDCYERNLKTLASIKHSGTSEASMEGMLAGFNPIVQPITDTLNYEFDFGDGWEIKIACCGTYAENDLKDVTPELSNQIQTVMTTGRPLCIALDGRRQLVQDVGGIYGYCDFLRTINGNDAKEKSEMKEWASGMSWTGRKASPEKLL